jgi:hypothetical protein
MLDDICGRLNLNLKYRTLIDKQTNTLCPALWTRLMIALTSQGWIFIFLKRGGVEKFLAGCKHAAPLSELRQGLGVKVKDFHIK